MKKYEIKIYWLNWVFKDNINWDIFKNNITYSSSINWPQWQCNINLNYKINDILPFIAWDIIKIYVFDEWFISWKLIYTWQIQVIEKNFLSNEQSINITVFWLWVLLNNLIFQSWWNKTFNKNQDPAQTVRDIIDYFNTIYTYWWLNYDSNSIVNFWSNININFDFTTCFSALKSIQDTTESYYWYIDNNWKVYYRSNEDINNLLHKPTVQKSVQSIQIKDTIENLYNYWYIKYNSWNTDYSDLTSIWIYWRIDTYQNKTDILDLTSATTFITDFINENKDISSETIITINNNFDNWYFIEDIKPGDRITILNFDWITNKQIVKITYTPTLLTVNLENYLSLNKILFN